MDFEPIRLEGEPVEPRLHSGRAVAEEAEGEPRVEWSKFKIGARVKGSVNELKEYGTLVDLNDDPNIVGLVAPHQVLPALYAL